MIVAVTGHRPDKLGGWRTPNDTYRRVLKGLDTALLTLRPEYVITGMALGVDQWMAELCAFNGIPFHAAIPFQGFESQWPMPAQMTFRHLLARAARVHVVCEGHFSPWKMQQRNMWMVDHCDKLIAVYDGSSGGTRNCVEYAMQRRREIWRVPLIQPPVAPVLRAPPPPIVLERASVVLRDRAISVREVPRENRPAHTQSEGTRAALRSAEEARLEAEAQERREEEIERRQRAAARRAALQDAQRLLAMVGVTDPEEEKKPVASKKSQKDDVPVVREFVRKVDLDL